MSWSFELNILKLLTLSLFLLASQFSFAAAGNTASQYTSIHLISINRTFTKNGLTKTFSTATYRDSYNFVNASASSVITADTDITGADVSGIIGCTLNIANYAGCSTQVTGTGLTSMDFGNALFDTLNRVKGAVDRDIAHVKIWLPAGTIAAPLSIFATQQAQTQFLAHLDTPPTGSFPKNTSLVPAGSPLSLLVAGQEVVGYNTAGGGSFQFSYFGDSMAPLPTGRWLYMDWYLTDVGYDGAGGQQPLGRMNGNIGLKNGPFQTEYKRLQECGAFDSNGDPIALNSDGSCPSGSGTTGPAPGSLPAPTILTPNSSINTTTLAIAGSQDASQGSVTDPVKVDIYVDNVKTATATVVGSGVGASWSQIVTVVGNGPHTVYAVATTNSKGSSTKSQPITVTVTSGTSAIPAPVVTALPSASGTTNSVSLSGTVAISTDATITGQTTVDIYVDGSKVGSATVLSTGASSASWTYTATSLAVGSHTFYAIAGKGTAQSSASNVVTYEVKGSPVPSGSSPQILKFPSRGGAYLSVSGVAPASTTAAQVRIMVYDDSTIPATQLTGSPAVVSGSDGSWTFTTPSTTALNVGNHRLYAVAVTGSTTSGQSNSIGYQVLSSSDKPNAPTITGLPDSGTSLTLSGTSDASLPLSIAQGDSDKVKITIFVDGVASNFSTFADDFGTWSVSLAGLPLGAHKFYATASKGSVLLSSGSSNVVSFTLLDPTPANTGAVPVITTLNADGTSNVINASATSTTFTVAGTVPSSGSVQGTTDSSTTTIDVVDVSTSPSSTLCAAIAVGADGKWTCNGKLPVGVHTLYAVANKGTGSSKVSTNSIPVKYSVVAIPANFGAKIDATSATLQGLTLKVASDDVGKRVALFVAIIIDRELYFVTPDGFVGYRDQYNKYVSGAISSASLYLATNSTGTFTYDVLPAAFKNMDLTKLVKVPGSSDKFVPIQVIAGYGVVNSDADLLTGFNAFSSTPPTDALNVMIRNGTYQSVLK